MSGRPRSSTTRSGGCWAAAWRSAAAPSAATSTSYWRARRLIRSARRICGSSSTTRIRGHARPPAAVRQRAGTIGRGRRRGSSSGVERAAHGLGEPAGQGQAEADAGVVVAVAEALERQEDPVAVGSRGCRGRGRRPAARPRPSCSLAVTERRPPGRAVAQRVGDQVDQDPFQQAGVGVHRGQVVGDAQAYAAAGRRRARRARGARPPPAPIAAGVTPSAPACRRLMSSRLATSRSSRSSDSSAVASSSSRSCVGERRRRCCAGWSTAALAEASGVRRSWLTAASSAVRIRSASASGSAWRGLARRAVPGAARRRPGRRTPRRCAGRRRPAAGRAARA